MKRVRFGGSFSIEVWIEIHGYRRMGMVVLKIPGDDLERGGNRAQKEFSRVRHCGLIVGSSILEFMPELLYL